MLPLRVAAYLHGTLFRVARSTKSVDSARTRLVRSARLRRNDRGRVVVWGGVQWLRRVPVRGAPGFGSVSVAERIPQRPAFQHAGMIGTCSLRICARQSSKTTGAV